MSDDKAKIIQGITLGNDTLIQQIVWTLMEKNIISKPDMIALLSRCVTAQERGGGPLNKIAAGHLAQMKKNVQTSAGVAPTAH
jgi:hypothetical protein